MKRIFLLIVGLFLAGSISSCVKNYHCDCVYDYLGFEDDAEPIQESSKLKARFFELAKDDCTNLETKYLLQNYHGSCLLK